MIWRTFQIVPKAAVASQDSALIHDLDMEKCEVEDTEFERDFELRIRGDCCLSSQDEQLVAFIFMFNVMPASFETNFQTFLNFSSCASLK